MKMAQERMTPDNYMQLHHRTLNRSIEDARNNNLNRAMEAFSNLNPAGAANKLQNEVNARTSETYMQLDTRQAFISALFFIGIGAAGSFLGAWLWREYQKRE